MPAWKVDADMTSEKGGISWPPFTIVILEFVLGQAFREVDFAELSTIAVEETRCSNLGL
jgi:hypothetical protein